MNLGPGEYVADPTEGITDPRDLPQPRIERRSRNLKRHSCPRCGPPARRDRELTRTLHDLGDLRAGRPVDLQATRQSKRIQDKITALFRHRHLFVKRRLTGRERKTFVRITRGLPHLRKLREIMEEVYKLFDRWCRTETALRKLAKLRTWVKRFQWVGQTLQKLLSPTLEKALTFDTVA